MPIDSPVGELFTLEELVTAARDGHSPLPQHQLPVLLVVAPQEQWAEITAVRMAKEGTIDQPLPATAVSVQMLPTLVVPLSTPDAATQEVAFGRSNTCAVALPFAAISKVHGFFKRQGEGWHIGDLGSKNGTYVDGHKVPANTTVPCRDGATLRFGDVTAKFLSPQSFAADVRRRLSQPV